MLANIEWLVKPDTIRAIDWIKLCWKTYPYLHMHSTERFTLCSNAELKRWFEKGSIQINGVRPKPFDLIEFPIWQLIYHPEGNRKTTLVDVEPTLHKFFEDLRLKKVVIE